MRRRNREINVFSVSAIDLFCSGMGAVMVLMVLLMPYYKKSSPELPAPPVLTTTPPLAEDVIRVEDIDIAFVMDATMSMKDEIEAIRTGLYYIVEVLRRLSKQTRVGFAAYVDREVPWKTPLLQVDQNPLGKVNLERLQQVLNSVELVGNEDWPEHLHGGLESATSMAWGTGSSRRQLIIVIGDASTHPEHRDLSLDLARRWSAASPGRGIHTLYTGKPEDAAIYADAAGSRDYFHELAAAGRGRCLERKQDLIGGILDLVIRP